uniref:Uncharacterized protein n=1 Tax=Lactuca sativa TaxID=4236 RepID=A0A9R1W8L8_LACSA|nr:hypothetical protein LSAT_V11C300119230 [Lactuca sativa]
MFRYLIVQHKCADVKVMDRDVIYEKYLNTTRRESSSRTIRPHAISSSYSINGLYFKVEDMKMVSEKKRSKLYVKKMCLLRERLFPNKTISLVTVSYFKSIILNNNLLVANDDDVVCLIYILCQWFLAKETNDHVHDDFFFFLLRTWMIGTCINCEIITINILYNFHKVVTYGSSHSMIARRLVDMDLRDRRRPGHKMTPSEEETRKSYYLSCLEYVFGEPTLVPSLMQKHFRRQEESSYSLSSSG